MGNFETFDKTKLPLKEKLYSSLNIEHINDADCKHANVTWEALK